MTDPTGTNDPLAPAWDGWDLPAFEVATLRDRQHRHALVIPVINEGERIRRQLLRIREARLPVDVIVADGGSTDGSLATDFVTEAGVCAVLTKTGPGKLGAQLRMAYAWCLRQGYEGIVTIDGNGKDGVEAVADMVAKLDQGSDYVQGSRYLPGGVAENTPLERTIANRCIHAPLLSLAGRHWFTDTTNGFRAYSARYLLDPRVRPFRAEFQLYGLLFYLTVRAGQLGMRVDHVPVTRRYPAHEAVPTKITGLSAKLRLLGEAVCAATGGFTPDEAAPPPRGWFWPGLFTLMVLLPFFLGAVVVPRYSPDSWALYELGASVFDDFYRFAHWRNYASLSEYSAAFPPLFPTLIAVIDSVAQTGARSGLYLSFAAFAAFALLSEAVGRRAFGVAWLGLAAGLVLLGGKELLTELTGGRTIPLQLALFALVLLGLLRGPAMTPAGGFAIGVLAGLAVLNRFDAVLLPVLAAALIWRLTRHPAPALAALVGAGLAVSPWVAYSLIHFGAVFTTDNAGVALSAARGAFVTDWWPAAQPTLWDDPSGWAARIAGHGLGFAAAIFGAATSRSAIGFALALGLVWGLYRLSRHGMPDGPKPTHSRTVITPFACILLLMLLPQLLTGYFGARYFTALLWTVFLLLAGGLVLQARSLHQRQVLARLLTLIVVVEVLGLSLRYLSQAWAEGRTDPAQWSRFEAPDRLADLKTCLGPDASARILVLGDDLLAAEMGALGGLRTMMEPANMRDGRLDAAGSRAFVAAWQVEYLWLGDPAREAWAQATFALRPVPDCPLPLYFLR